MTKPYLKDIINDHKTQGEWKFHSANEAIDYKTQRKWKRTATDMRYFAGSKFSMTLVHKKA